VEEEVRPALADEVTFAPAVAICVHGPADEPARSILNPVSLLELSDQVRLIWLEDTALATKLLGALGGVDAPGVVTLIAEEVARLPFGATALTL
jgi:predicted alpha/beta-hydrolase family hydrolase